MSTQVVVTLPEEAYRRAESLADMTSRDVADVVADAAVLWLERVGERTQGDRPVEELSNGEILALSEMQMKPKQSRRMSILLERQQDDVLTPAGRLELAALLQVYQEGLLRKAQALREAVQRGLRGPLEP